MTSLANPRKIAARPSHPNNRALFGIPDKLVYLEQMISVCMATYNGAPFIERQLRSILMQLSKEDEVVISDDGSTDGTLSLIASFNDARIHVLHNPTKNLIKNFENTLKHAKGDYIFLADQDDVWRHDKVSLCGNALQEFTLVLSDCSLIDKDENVLHPSYFKLQPPRRSLFGNLYKNSYLGCCMAFQRKVLEKALPFPQNIPMHDSWLGIVAQTLGPVHCIEEPLVLYRRHQSATSTTGMQSQQATVKRFKDRWNLLVPLIKRSLRLA
jgi:glycosyltransferase involved in cell wall biosynthesis